MTRAVYRCGQKTHCSRCGEIFDDEWIFLRWDENKGSIMFQRMISSLKTRMWKWRRLKRPRQRRFINRNIPGAICKCGAKIISIEKIGDEECALNLEEHLDDVFVQMPPVKTRTARVKIKSIQSVNPENRKYKCDGCDYLCSLLTASDAPPPKVCAMGIIERLSGKPLWREMGV